jgi:hypothetical protein
MLTDDGTSSGDSSITGDYSATPKDFWIEPPSGVNYLALSVQLYISMKPVPDKTDYGETVAGLANGVLFVFKRGTYENVLNPLGPIKNHADLIYANGRRINTMLNGAAELNIFEFNFLKSFGIPLPLFGSVPDQFIVRVNDDFGDQAIQRFSVNGIRQAVTKAQQL